MPTPPLYSDRAPRRLLPNAADCANGDAAPLFTLPLIRNPSDGVWFVSAGAAVLGSAGGVFGASPPDALASVFWNPPCCGTSDCASCLPFPLAAGASDLRGGAAAAAGERFAVTGAGGGGGGAAALISSN